VAPDHELLGVVEMTEDEKQQVDFGHAGWEWAQGVLRRAALGGEAAAAYVERLWDAEPAGPGRPDSLKDFRGLQAFADWEESHPARVAQAALKILHETADALLRLGAEASGPAGVKVLKQYIERFNELNDKECFIDTIDREDICEYLYRLAELSGLEEHAESVEELRDW